jgi:GNAT superfamily N-acetyltransferase
MLGDIKKKLENINEKRKAIKENFKLTDLKINKIEIPSIDGIYFEVVYNDKIIAKSSIGLLKECASLFSLKVYKSYRNLGVGSFLLEDIEKTVKNLKKQKLLLRSIPTSKHFYFKNGYTQMPPESLFFEKEL